MKFEKQDFHSPIGPLPDGWELVSLKDLCRKIGTGATPRGGSQVYLPQRVNYGLVRSQNVFDAYFNIDGFVFIADKDADRLANANVEAGDIFLNITGDGVTFGRACIVPDTVLPAVVNQHVCIIRTEPLLCHPRYLLSYLTHPIIKEYIESFNSGGSRRAITKGHIESFQVPVAPYPVQLAISSILKALDDKIELNHRMNETLESIARAIFKSWFVDFDPVRAKLEGQSHEQLSGASAYPMPAEVYDLFPSAFQDSELGKIPEGWEVGTLSSIAPLQTTTVKPQNHKNTLWQHFSIPAFDVDKNPVDEYGSEIKSNKYAVPDACVLLSKLNPRTPRIWIPSVRDSSTAICSTEFMPFVPMTKSHLPFVYEQICSDSLQADVLARATGSTGSRQRVKPKEIAEILVIVPGTELIDSFCSIAGPMIELALNNQTESVNLAQLRDTLLPKLLSGELTVPDDLLQAQEVL